MKISKRQMMGSAVAALLTAAAPWTAQAAGVSDKEIVDTLSSRGIPIARRTVAKYRAELNILPSNMRKLY